MTHKWVCDWKRSKRMVAFYDCPGCGARLVSSPAACIITTKDGQSDIFCAAQNKCPDDGHETPEA